MANTESFKAKLRSQSASKQRPEPRPKKRLSLDEMLESKSSLSGVKMQRSCSRVQEAINLWMLGKKGLLGVFPALQLRWRRRRWKLEVEEIEFVIKLIFF